MFKHVSVSCGVGVCALAICSTFAFPAVAGELPTGTFTANHTPFTMSIDDKGQFRVNQAATLEVLGNYSVKANVITFTDTSGPWACTGAGENAGTYSWKYEDSVLTLAKVTDKCSDRVKSLVSRAWRRQN